MITILGELYSSKNGTRILRNRQTGKPFVAKKAKAKDAEQGMLLQLQAQKQEWKRMVKKSGLPFRVHFKFYRRTRMRFDYVNLLQNLADNMVKAGYLFDDN